MSGEIEFSKLKEGKIILFVTNTKKYNKVNMEILKHYLNEKKHYCVYVTVNKPYATLKKSLENKEIDLEKIFFIDAVSPTEETRSGNAVFLGSPKALTKISLVSTKALEKMPKKKRFLFIDSVTTLSLYNETGNVSKFMDFLIKKMREGGITASIISLKKEKSEDISNYLSQLVDEVVEVD